MRYAVSLLNFFDNENETTIVEADSPNEAMIEGARDLMGATKSDEWLNSMLGNDPEDIAQEFFNADMAISLAIPVD